MKNQRRAFITGIKSIKLNKKEKLFLKKYRPWGVILFSRNIRSISQTTKLTTDIKNIFRDVNYPILIDEEGGAVTRLNKIIDNSYFSANFFLKVYNLNPKRFNEYLYIYVKQICFLLRTLGININTVPVLDILRKNSSKILKNRTYGKNPKIVRNIGIQIIRLFHKFKIATVMKHIPGHGAAKVDSHKKNPIVKESLQTLKIKDFFAFKKQKSLLAMTAHVTFKNLDTKPATLSKKLIYQIRKTVAFKGIIITDDISMKALNYSIKENTIRAFTSGCDLVLHCNAKYKEMLSVAKNSPFISKFIIKKTSELYKIIS